MLDSEQMHKPEDPLVSFLMTSYNSVEFIGKAVNSILSQTSPEWQLVIVDDGSKDNTPSLIRNLSDPRITKIFLPENIGISGALNIGLGKVRGRYIARLDSDDTAYPERLRIQASFMEANPDVVLMGARLEVDGSKGSRVLGHPPSNNVGPELLRGNRLLSSSTMFRRNVVHEMGLKFSLTHPNAQDYEFWLQLSQYGRIVLESSVVGTYRIHSGQQTSINSVRQRLLGLQTQLAALLWQYNVRGARIHHYARGWIGLCRNLLSLAKLRLRIWSTGMGS